MHYGVNSSLAFIGGALLGAGLMYYLDPDRGRRRRALVRDKMTHIQHKTTDAVTAQARDLRNRAKGLVAETKSALTSSTKTDEQPA